MTTRKITARLLQSKGACANQVAKFRETFPRGVVPTVELAEQHASAFDWNWAAEHLLSPAAWAEYKRVRASALAEYERVVARAFVELWSKE